MPTYKNENPNQRETPIYFPIISQKTDTLDTGNFDPSRAYIAPVRLDLSQLKIISARCLIIGDIWQYIVSSNQISNDSTVNIKAGFRYIETPDNGSIPLNERHWKLSDDVSGSDVGDFTSNIEIKKPGVGTENHHFFIVDVDLKNRPAINIVTEEEIPDASQLFRKPGVLSLLIYHDATPAINTYGSGVDGLQVKGLTVEKSLNLQVATKYRSSN